MEKKLDRIIELLEMIVDEAGIDIKKVSKEDDGRQLLYDYLISINHPPKWVTKNLNEDNGKYMKEKAGDMTVEEYYNSKKMNLKKRFKGVFGKSTINQIMQRIEHDFDTEQFFEYSKFALSTLKNEY